MASSIINSDDGSVSGTTGLKTTGGDDGELILQTNGADSVTLSPSAVVINESGADVDFRIESDTNANAFFLDAGNSRIGIGTNSPGAKLEINTGSSWGSIINSTYATTQYFMQFEYNGTAIGKIRGDNSSISLESGSNLILQTANTERMRIDSSGNVLVGAASQSSVGKLYIEFNQSANQGIGLQNSNAGNGANYIIFRNSSGGQAGIISQTGATSVNYGTSSDYRLKENWQPMSGSIDRLKNLNPVNFAWKADGKRVDGFLAHEAAEVVPEAVVGEKDAVDKDNKPIMQSIDQSKLVPLLTAALQEAVAKIEALETRIAALESN